MLAKPITATVWSRPGALAGASPLASASRSRSTSRMSAGRRAGSFSIMRSESSPRPAASGLSAEIGCGSLVRIASTCSTAFLPSNGRRPRQHLVEHDAQREDVAARVDRVAARLLGRHVGERPHDQALERAVPAAPGERVLVRGRGEAREAEVEHLDAPALAQHHVPRLDVAVHDAVLVGVGERLGHLLRDRQHLLGSDAAPRAAARRASGPARTPSRCSAACAPLRIRLAHVVDHGDVRVRERRGHARLAHEAGRRLAVPRGRRGQPLERDEPVQPRVLGEPDLAHGSGPEALLEPVVCESLLFGHGLPSL